MDDPRSDPAGSAELLSWNDQMSRFRSLHDPVVLRRLAAEEKTAGGIIVPGTTHEKPTEADVIAAGPGARNELGQAVPLEVKPGDKVLFGKWSGTEVKLNNEELSDKFGNLGARLLREGAKAVAAGLNPLDLKRGIDKGATAVLDELKKRTRKIATAEDTSQVATISPNGEAGIGTIISDAVQRVGGDGVITV